MGFLYKLDFASGKSYVGITNLSSVERRMKSHRNALAYGRKLAVYNAWRKHGAPEVTVLACANGKFLLELEQRAVRVYGTFGSGGYNLSPGGESRDYAPESRAKIAAAKLGLSPSEATRAKIAKTMTGRKQLLKTIAKRTATLIGLGRACSDEHRAKTAASLRGRKRDPEIFKKMWATRRQGV